MQYAICLQPYIPMRAEAAEPSEMISQLLFGDTFRIVDEVPRWYRIVRDYDGYEGWIDWKTATLLEATAYDSYVRASAEAPLLRQPFTTVTIVRQGQPGQTQAHLSWGSRLFGLDDLGNTFRIEGLRFDVATSAYIQPVAVSAMSRRACSKYLLQQASLLFNVPYLWGGLSAFGLDCSGFIQTLFRFVGIALPRDASDQAQQGEATTYDGRQPGDLAFFGREGRVSHVGLVGEEDRIFHVSGSLHIDRLRPDGIWSDERQELTHSLIAVRHLF